MNKCYHNIKWGVISLIAVATLGLNACDDDLDHNVPTVGSLSLEKVEHGGQAIAASAGALTFDVTRVDADTVTLTFDKPVFFTDLDKGKVTVTNGAQVTNVTAGGAGSKTFTVYLNIPDLNKSYDINIEAGCITNGQLLAYAQDINITLKGMMTPTIADAPVMATSPEATALYNFLKANYGQKIISGMMAKVAWNTDYADSVGTAYGKTPLINGFDYIHLLSEKDGWIDYTDITPVKNWVAKGGIATMTWHRMVPQTPYATGSNDLTITWDQMELNEMKAGDVLTFDLRDIKESYEVCKVCNEKDCKHKNQEKTEIFPAKYAFKYADGTKIEGLEEGSIKSSPISLAMTDEILAQAKSHGGINLSGNDFTIYNVTCGGINLKMTAEQQKDAYDNIPTSGSGSTLSYSTSSQFKASRIFKEDGTVNEGCWEGYVYSRGMETVIERLTLLKDAGIPVLWRPYHEASGKWFWWGEDAATFKKLWVDMFNRFKEAGLDNLIWVWTSEVNDLNNWYPGDEYVDIIGVDIYGGALSTSSYDFRTLKGKMGKMITLSECGYSSSSKSRIAKISEQTGAGICWSWFMPWYDDSKSKAEEHHADDAWWKDAIGADNVLWLGDYAK